MQKSVALQAKSGEDKSKYPKLLKGLNKLDFVSYLPMPDLGLDALDELVDKDNKAKESRR